MPPLLARLRVAPGRGGALVVPRSVLWPALAFGAAWGGAVVVLAASTGSVPVDSMLIGAAYLALAAATVRVTRPAPAAPATAAPGRTWLQLAVILGFVLLTAWSGLAFHGVVGDAVVPVWSPLVDALASAGGTWFGNDHYVVNPVVYGVLPLAVLLLLGARLPELGLGRGHRVGRVLLLWAAIPVAWLGFAVLTGQLTLARVVNRLVSNAMQNGPWEEFLFRGALQTRLRRLVTPEWAVVLQALVFGAWHLGLGVTSTGGAGLLPALASTIVHQAVIGLAFGIVFERTRNLLVPSVAHVLANSMG